MDNSKYMSVINVVKCNYVRYYSYFETQMHNAYFLSWVVN